MGPYFRPQRRVLGGYLLSAQERSGAHRVCEYLARPVERGGGDRLGARLQTAAGHARAAAVPHEGPAFPCRQLSKQTRETNDATATAASPTGANPTECFLVCLTLCAVERGAHERAQPTRCGARARARTCHSALRRSDHVRRIALTAASSLCPRSCNRRPSCDQTSHTLHSEHTRKLRAAPHPTVENVPWTGWKCIELIG